MTGTQPPPQGPAWNAPPQWTRPQPPVRRRPSTRTVVAALIALAVFVAGAGLLAFRAKTGRYPWQSGPRDIALIPDDVCGFVGRDALGLVIPGATFTSKPADLLDLPATCEAENAKAGEKVTVDLRRYEDSLSTTAEEKARRFFTQRCENFSGGWQTTNPDDPSVSSPVPAPNLGQEVCGEPGSFTELTVLQGYTVITIRFTSRPTDESPTLPDKATMLARRVLEQLETLQ